MHSERRVVSITPNISFPEPVIVQHRTQVSHRISEQVNLQLVLGKEMYTTFRRVLDELGASMGWIRDELNPELFIKTIQSGVEILIDLGEQIPVVILNAARAVDSGQRLQVEQELARLLEEVKPEYQLEMNKLLNVCFIEGIKTAIEGSQWEETINMFYPETQTHTVEILLTIP